MTEHDWSRAMWMDDGGVKRMAIGVIAKAAEDFHVLDGMGLRFDPRWSPTVRLRRVHDQIDAGRFLLERTDPLTRLWFTLAGISMDGLRDARPQWHDRLAMLREAKATLQRQVPNVTQVAASA